MAMLKFLKTLVRKLRNPVADGLYEIQYLDGKKSVIDGLEKIEMNRIDINDGVHIFSFNGPVEYDMYDSIRQQVLQLFPADHVVFITDDTVKYMRLTKIA